MRQLDKQVDEQREQRNSYENQIYATNNQLEELKNQMQWDQHALEAWLEESARRDEDALVLQKFAKYDDSKIKVMQSFCWYCFSKCFRNYNYPLKN